jgi:tetratricopeptide (TPR) repeat protein
VGRHYRIAGDPGAALDWLVAAAREAARAQARHEALQAYDDALEAAGEAGLDPGSAFVASLRIERGGLLARRSDLHAARTELEGALKDVRANGERDLECRAEAELGFLLAGSADYRAALTHLEAALLIAEERRDTAARVTALARLSIVHTNLARLDLGRAFGGRALSAARASGDERLLAVALDAQKQVVLQLGDGEGLSEIADELEAIHRWNDELWLLQFVLFERGYVAVGTARWDEAESRLREALEISRRIGDRGNELLHLSMLGWRDRCRGDLARALESLEDVRRRAHEMGHAEWSAWTSLLLGATFLDLEEPKEAAPHLTDAVRSGEEGEARLHLVRAIAQLAWCSWLMGDHDAAADHAARSLSMLDDIVCPEGTAYMPGADAYLATARVLLAMGEAERGATLVQPIVDAGGRVGWVEAQAGGAVVLGRCAEAAGRTDEALELFRDAIKISVDKGMPVVERDGRVAIATALATTDADEAGRQAGLAAAITAGLRAGTQGARLDEGDLPAPSGSTGE